MKTGADISHYQGSFVPSTYKGAGEDFVILKATESTTYKDPTFNSRWKACRDADLPRGAYHFARPSSGAAAQADYFIAVLQAQGFTTDDTWALDMEDAGGQGASTLVSWSETFCDKVAAALGGPGLFYSYLPFIRDTMGNPGRVPGGCLAWVARYASSPYQDPYPCPKGWPDPPDLWQCSNGEVGCVKNVASIGHCDYNHMTDDAFAKLFSAGGGTDWWLD